MVQVDFELPWRRLRHRAVRRNALQTRQFVDLAQHVGEMVQVIDGIHLALSVALLRARRARRLQIALRVALTIDEIELQLYRYHGESPR